MRRRFRDVATILAAATAAAIACGQSPPPQPTGVRAFHASGQTFVTWRDAEQAPGAVLPGARYHVYRHRAPITVATLGEAQKLTQRPNPFNPLLDAVPNHSSRLFADLFGARVTNPFPIGPRQVPLWTPRYADHHIVPGPDGPRRLGCDEGLLVWTIHPTDLDHAMGPVYYAVTTVDAEGLENDEELTDENTTFVLEERVEDPLPVDITAEVPHTGGVRVYMQYMDLRHWNPTFHAPNALINSYIFSFSCNRFEVVLDDGFNPVFSPDVLQYTYVYTVALPPLLAPRVGPAAAPRPVVLQLHYGLDPLGNPPLEGSVTFPPETTSSTYAGAICVRPYDLGNTFWFGFAKEYDYRMHPFGGPRFPVRPDGSAAAGTVVNYTERRVLRILHDLKRMAGRPGSGLPPIDERRIYVEGHSMGAVGALSMVLRHPDVFAGGYAKQGPVDFRASSTKAPMIFPQGFERLFHRSPLNAPVEIRGVGSPPPLIPPASGDPRSVWDHVNLVRPLVKRPGDERAPFAVEYGKADDLVLILDQGLPFFQAAAKAGLCWGGIANDDIHTPIGVHSALPPSIAGATPNPTPCPEIDDPIAWPCSAELPYHGFGLVRDETVPGLSRASGDRPLPDGYPNGFSAPHFHNQTIEWSSSWNAWDGPPADTPKLWKMSLRNAPEATFPPFSPRIQTVDVTLRRTQKFAIEPGSAYLWTVMDSLTGDVFAQGHVKPDGHGRLTIPAVPVTDELPSGGYPALVVVPLP